MLDPATPILRLFDVPLGDRRLHVDLHPGERYAAYAPNGAGKSTLIRAIAGLGPPPVGIVQVAGGSPGFARGKGWVGVVPDRPVHAGWTCSELLAIVQHLAGTSVDGSLLKIFGLNPTQRATALSHGESRRLALALALAGRPRLLLWDEPWTALDERYRSVSLELVASANRAGMAVFALAPSPTDLPNEFFGAPA
jgi:ABC-2 type transport system ATP-binding protein